MNTQSVIGTRAAVRVVAGIAAFLVLGGAPLAGQEPLPGHAPVGVQGPPNRSKPVAIKSCAAADSVFGKPRTFSDDLTQVLRDSSRIFLMVGGPGPGMVIGDGEGIQLLQGTVTITDPPAPDPKYEFIIMLHERHELPIEERQLAFVVDDTTSIPIGSMSMHVEPSPFIAGMLGVNLYTVLQPDIFRRLAGARKVEMTLGSLKVKWDSRQRDQIAAAYAAAVCGVPQS